ncbi:MAG: hypothetical protein ACK4N1_10800 [Pseudorhizobium sp.]
MFAGEQVRLSQTKAESRFANITHFAEHTRGDHFAVLEAPAALVADIRQTLRTQR